MTLNNNSITYTHNYSVGYNVRILLVWIAYFFTCIQYVISWHIKDSDIVCRYLIAGCLLLSIRYEKIDKNKLFLFFFLIISLFLRRLLIVWCLLALAYQIDEYRIPLRKITKFALIILVIIFFVLIDGILIGIIENEGLKYIKSDRLIYDLGTGNANRCASLFFKLVILLYLLLKDTKRKLFVLTTLCISYLGYLINGSRAVLLSSLLLIILSYGYWFHLYKNWMKYIIAGLPVVMYIFTFYLALHLEDYKDINEMASGRLWYIVRFTQEFQTIDWLIGAPRTLNEPLDSSYLEIIHTGGICLASFFCISYASSILYNYKKLISYLPVLITILIMGLSESILLRPSDISVILWVLILQKFIKYKPII